MLNVVDNKNGGDHDNHEDNDADDTNNDHVCECPSLSFFHLPSRKCL